MDRLIDVHVHSLLSTRFDIQVEYVKKLRFNRFHFYINIMNIKVIKAKQIIGLGINCTSISDLQRV